MANTPTKVPQNIYNAVEPTAKKYNVPDWLWELIAYEESGFNPNAVGDSGTSFGLFQLHKGGQLPSKYNNSPSAVYDPTLNAQIAIPYIASGLQQSGTPNTGSLTWWERFASASGHPGGTPGVDPANINLAEKFNQDYTMFANGVSIGPDTNPPSSNGFPITIPGITLPTTAQWTQVGFVIFGAIIVIIAIFLLFKGGNNA